MSDNNNSIRNSRDSRNNGNANGGANNNNNPSNSDYGWGAAAIVGAIGAAALSYWYMKPSKDKNKEIPSSQTQRDNSKDLPKQPHHNNSQRPAEEANQQSDRQSRPSVISSLCKRLIAAEDNMSSYVPEGRGISRNSIPDEPCITNLNSLLHDIYQRYIKLKDNDFEIHCRVFNVIFNRLLKTMKEVDAYFNRYSSRAQFAGSHYDRLRIKKPDEFDMDIVIGLPLNINQDPYNAASSDIILEPKGSGYVQLKMGVQFQKLPFRDGDQWLINQTAYKWKDERNYLLREKFINWFKSVVDTALNRHPVFFVDGDSYTVKRSHSHGGTAITLYIINSSGSFKMDVDLVPALKFPESRWPICRGYREIPPGCNATQSMWMVVPKENENAPDADKPRSWRLAMHDQERGLMYASQNMKQTIRLMKKLRDSLEMNKIASYYVKTLFFHVAIEQRQNPLFWRKSVGELFQIMVGKLYSALVAGNISYFWDKSDNNNLIGKVSRDILDSYARKLSRLKTVLERPEDYKVVAKYLLTPEEFQYYNRNFLHI